MQILFSLVYTLTRTKIIDRMHYCETVRIIADNRRIFDHCLERRHPECYRTLLHTACTQRLQHTSATLECSAIEKTFVRTPVVPVHSLRGLLDVYGRWIRGGKFSFYYTVVWKVLLRTYRVVVDSPAPVVHSCYLSIMSFLCVRAKRYDPTKVHFVIVLLISIQFITFFLQTLAVSGAQWCQFSRFNCKVDRSILAISFQFSVVISMI